MIILGLIAGFIGSKIVNRTGEGIILDVVLGVVGAVIEGYLFSLFGAEGVTGLDLWSLLVAVIGAIVVLLGLQIDCRRGRKPGRARLTDMRTPRRPAERGSVIPGWIPPQLSLPVETAPCGPQWLHEIKLDGFRMAARIDHGRVQLLTRTGLDWSDKYPSTIAALANVRATSAYLDGELCGIDGAGLPSFSQTQAASDGEGGVPLVF